MWNDGDKLPYYAASARRNGGGGHTVDIQSYVTVQIKTLAGTIPTGTTVSSFITQVRAGIATFENASGIEVSLMLGMVWRMERCQSLVHEREPCQSNEPTVKLKICK